MEEILNYINISIIFILRAYKKSIQLNNRKQTVKSKMDNCKSMANFDTGQGNSTQTHNEVSFYTC